MNDFPYLSVLTCAPLVGAVVVALLPRSRPELAKRVALGWSLAVLVFAGVVWWAFDTNFAPGGERLVLRESYTWIPQWDVNLTVATDGIGLVMLALIALLVPVVILASWHDADQGAAGRGEAAPGADEKPGSKRSVPAFFALILVLEFTMLGVFAAADIFLFYVFFEVMLVPMYFLIGSYGGARRQYAAVKFFLYSLVGGLFMLAAVVGVWALGAQTLDWQTVVSEVDFSTGAERWLFLGFFLAFAIKAPFFPFHTWLPDAGGAAPAGVAALLVGVLDKVATFGILRYSLPLFPDAARWFAPVALALAVVGIIYAALLAVGQNDLKRLVAYSSIAHFGFIGVGIFVFTTQAGTGAVLYMVNHGLATGMMFLVVGMLVARRGSALISDFGGAGKLVPLLAGVLLFAGLASLSLPGLAPFVSEFLVLIGAFTVNKPVAVIATVGIILAAAYVLWMIQRTTHGTLNPRLRDVEPMRRDLSWREKLVVAPLILLLIGFGFYPKPLTDVINPAVEATLTEVGVEEPEPAPTVQLEAQP